jgi:hypothetical protein
VVCQATSAQQRRVWIVGSDDHLFLGTTYTDDGTLLPRRYILGYGGRFRVFRGGLPRDFVQRTGATASDFHFSGVYEAGGNRIGYLRIPNFGPPNTDAAIPVLRMTSTTSPSVLASKNRISCSSSWAYSENRGRTGSIPACTEFRSASPAGFMNPPARVVYTKPIIFLIDEFSTSAGDTFQP